MPDESTVAPKERVNIVYKADTGGMQEEVELPLRLLVVGNFTGREDPKTAIEKRDVTNIDKDSFQEVLKGSEVVIDLDVPDVISGKSEGRLRTQIPIRNMDDFEPDKIVDNVKELRELMELRQALIELKGPLDQYDDFRARLQGLLDGELKDKQEGGSSILESLQVGSSDGEKS